MVLWVSVKYKPYFLEPWRLFCYSFKAIAERRFVQIKANRTPILVPFKVNGVDFKKFGIHRKIEPLIHFFSCFGEFAFQNWAWICPPWTCSNRLFLRLCHDKKGACLSLLLLSSEKRFYNSQGLLWHLNGEVSRIAALCGINAMKHFLLLFFFWSCSQFWSGFNLEF